MRCRAFESPHISLSKPANHPDKNVQNAKSDIYFAKTGQPDRTNQLKLIVISYGLQEPGSLTVVKIPFSRVGCAHQISLMPSVNGGHSPPYTNRTGINHLRVHATISQFRFTPVLVRMK